jgi:hypothetical protein
MESKKHENAPVCMLCGLLIKKKASRSALAHHLYFDCHLTLDRRIPSRTHRTCPCGESWFYDKQSVCIDPGSVVGRHFRKDVTVEQHLLRMIQK